MRNALQVGIETVEVTVEVVEELYMLKRLFIMLVLGLTFSQAAFAVERRWDQVGQGSVGCTKNPTYNNKQTNQDHVPAERTAHEPGRQGSREAS